MKFLKSLQIEEIVLIGISLFFLTLLYLLGFFSSDIKLIFSRGWANIAFVFQLWTSGIVIFLVLWAYPLFVITNRRKSFFNYFHKEGVKNFFIQFLSFLKTFVIITTTTTLGMLVVGILQQETKNRVINLQLMNADKFLVKDYPIFWLHSSSNILSSFFNFLTPAMIYSFLSLAGVMGTAAFIFYFGKNKNVFKGYIMSISIVFALAMPLWFFFPANSPANYFLHNSNANFTAELSEAISQYQPNARVMAYQEKMWQKQKNFLPVSTMPSMHWAWSIIIVYYLFKKERKTIILSSIWLIFNLFGTIYLGNHYLIDGLVAIPLVILSLYFANLFSKLKPE